MSSRFDDICDSLILQGCGSIVLSRVPTMLAAVGVAIGQTRGIADVGTLEQNKVLRRLRIVTLLILMKGGLLSLSRQAW
jgi:hypothetical protein